MKIYSKRSLDENMCGPITASDWASSISITEKSLLLISLFHSLVIAYAVPHSSALLPFFKPDNGRYFMHLLVQTSDVTVMPNNKLVEKT